MKKINKPEFDIVDVLQSSIKNMKDFIKKQELNDSKMIFFIAEAEFDICARKNQLYIIKTNETISETIDKSVIISLYEDRMLKKNNEARKYYDKIRASAINGKCCYCGVGTVTTLDHYLPKSIYPLLSISPLNLVPCCSDCNKNKLSEKPKKSEDEALHPYYDDVEDLIWLQAQIVNILPDPEFEFFVSDSVIDPILKIRIAEHIQLFKLDYLYNLQSIEEFFNIEHNLKKLYRETSIEEIKEFLHDAYLSRKKIYNNSWATAFYYCLYQNTNIVFEYLETKFSSQ